MNPRLAISAAALSLLGVAALLLAGPLNPPSGPVAPTYKTLSDVEPRIAVSATNTPGDSDSLYKISQPGSYYLTANLTGAPNKHGIEITASNVTLDLMGFQLLGVPGSLDAISATTGVNSVQVRHGTISSWGDMGIDLTNGAGLTVSDIAVDSCARFGISVNLNSRVTACTVRSNGAAGIALGANCTVTACTAYSNAGAGGILGWTACTITDSTSYANALDGINTRDGSTVRNCSVFSNTGHGITVTNGCTVSGCTIYDNSAIGLFAGAGNSISDCTARSNGSGGIIAGDGATITDCTMRENVGNGITLNSNSRVARCTSDANLGNGISAQINNQISDSVCNNNTNHGILVTHSCSIDRCTVVSNSLDGIEFEFRGIVTNNTCIGNGNPSGAGIHAISNFSRIEGNTCASNTRGIDVDSSANIIIRNVCRGNVTNWDLAANNVVGPILNRRTPASAAIVGDSGPSSLGTTDANANFTY